MTEERCERTELIVSQCADSVVDGVELDGRERQDETAGPTVEARFAGRCPVCDEWIRVGDLITKIGGVSNSALQWVCAGCAP